jgi:ankyrin repeat protein
LQYLDSNTPVLEAIWCNQPQVVQLLLEAGASLEAGDHDGYTPLHAAAAQGMTNLVEELLRMGADLRAENSRGNTALAVAAEYGQAAVVELLLEVRGQPQVTSWDLARAAKLPARDELLVQQPTSQHVAVFTRLVKELHRWYPANVQLLFQDPNPVPAVAAMAALLDGWASDVSGIDAQRAAVRAQEQDVGHEKKAVQQLLLSMACAKRFAPHELLQGVDGGGGSRKRPRPDS